MIFGNRASYTKSVHEEVKAWVALNINTWIEEKPEWFDINLIFDGMIPDDILASAEVGHIKNRRKQKRANSLSVHEIMRSNSYRGQK